ncbi:MAG: hypothetical protein PHC70_02195 [Patescibacteria group bacterium]|nr:hypothetical protein [Patescibacteria group bacterium]
MAQTNPIASDSSMKSPLRVVKSTCACGNEIRGDHPTCYQCFMNAGVAPNELLPCMNDGCNAKTQMNFCIRCHKSLGEEARRTAYRAFRTNHSDDPRFHKRNAPATEDAPPSSSKVSSASPKPEEKSSKSIEPVVTTVETEDATIEYREATGNELVVVRLVLAEIEEEEERELQKKAAAAMKVQEAKALEAEKAHVAKLRKELYDAYLARGKYGLLSFAVDTVITEYTPVDVDGKKYVNPHFTVRVKDQLSIHGCREFEFNDKEAEETLKKARRDFSDRQREAAKARREAEAAARRAKHAPKKDEPKPGKSGGDGGKGKGGKNGKSGKDNKGKNKK